MKKRISVKEFKKYLKEANTHIGLEDSINRFSKYWDDYSEMTSITEIEVDNKTGTGSSRFVIEDGEDPTVFFNKVIEEFGINNLSAVYVYGFDDDGNNMMLIIDDNGIEEHYL